MFVCVVDGVCDDEMMYEWCVGDVLLMDVCESVDVCDVGVD